MATYNLATIRANIKTILSGITALAYVYDYYNPAIAGYPAVIFDIINEDGSMLDDSNNLRVITFGIYLYVEIPVQGQIAAKDSLDTLTALVVNALELKSNDTLSGACDWLMPTVGRRQQIETTEGMVFMQELQVKVNVASTIL